MNIPFIDLKTQYHALKSDIDARIMKVLEHGQFIMGPEVKDAETELQKFTGAKHAITCANGSDAIMMAVMALGLKSGDEVITTAFSFIATAEMIAILGIKPVFVDIDPQTYNIDIKKIPAAITSKTKAIMPVSLYGQPADFDEINDLAAIHKLYVIEDAAQSFGAIYKNKRSCNLSDVGCTSFFPAKPLGCYGDGGAIFTNNDAIADALKSIRVHGMGEHRYHHPRIGINGRLDSIQCAVIVSKLKRYEWELEQRQRIADRYNADLKVLHEVGVRTPYVHSYNRSVWAQYTLWVPDRTSLQNHLQKLGIPTAIHYPITMADQPAYSGISTIHDISNARNASEHVMSFPMYPDMSSDVQDRVIEGIKSFYNV